MVNVFKWFTLGIAGIVIVILLIWGIPKTGSSLEFNGNVSIKIDKS